MVRDRSSRPEETDASAADADRAPAGSTDIPSEDSIALPDVSSSLPESIPTEASPLTAHAADAPSMTDETAISRAEPNPTESIRTIRETTIDPAPIAERNRAGVPSESGAPPARPADPVVLMPRKPDLSSPVVESGIDVASPTSRPPVDDSGNEPVETPAPASVAGSGGGPSFRFNRRRSDGRPGIESGGDVQRTGPSVETAPMATPTESASRELASVGRGPSVRLDLPELREARRIGPLQRRSRRGCRRRTSFGSSNAAARSRGRTAGRKRRSRRSSHALKWLSSTQNGRRGSGTRTPHGAGRVGIDEQQGRSPVRRPHRRLRA